MGRDELKTVNESYFAIGNCRGPGIRFVWIVYVLSNGHTRLETVRYHSAQSLNKKVLELNRIENKKKERLIEKFENIYSKKLAYVSPFRMSFVKSEIFIP